MQFNDQKYYLRRQIINLLGAKLTVTDNQGNVVLFAHQKAFKLKEDIRLYSDQTMQTTLMTITARRMLDIATTYDVNDVSGNRIGSLKRDLVSAIARDTWVIMDPNDQQVAMVKEDSMALALVRRYLLNIIPQNYDILMGQEKVADFKQNFNPFVLKMELDFSFDKSGKLNRQLGIAAAVLLTFIEGRQD